MHQATFHVLLIVLLIHLPVLKIHLIVLVLLLMLLFDRAVCWQHPLVDFTILLPVVSNQ